MHETLTESFSAIAALASIANLIIVSRLAFYFGKIDARVCGLEQELKTVRKKVFS
jgi:hypothetical protein